MAQSKKLDSQVKRYKNAQEVNNTHIKSIAKQFDDLASTVVGSPCTPAQDFLDCYDKVTNHVINQSAESDAALIREQAETQDALNTRDEQGNQSRSGTIRTKNSVSSIYGEEVLVALGLNGETPGDPVLLERALSNAITILEGWKEMPKPLDGEDDAPAWTVKALLRRLTKLRDPLVTALQNATREAKEDQDAQIKRRDCLDRSHRYLVGYDSILETMARITRNDEIANRVRAQGGRTRKKEETTDSPENPTTPSEPPANPPT